ncbi:MAG: trimethylamine methyltransferase family protein [Gaiellales bacterium]
MRPRLRVLDDDLSGRIIAEARRVLAVTGIEVRGEALRRRLVAAGLPTDAGGERVLFPADVVDEALRTAPSTFTLYDRAGDPHAELGGDNVHFVPGSSGLRVTDHRSGETRLATTADFVEYVRLGHGLESIRNLATAFSTDDVPAEISDAWRLLLCLTNTTKPIVSGSFTEHGVPRMAQLMELFRADRADLIARPMSIFTVTATGNFRYGEDSCQNLLDCAEAGIPIEIVPVTLMGLIAPVTLVGATVFHTVDTLAGVVMAQVVRPGTPVLFGGAPATFHMKAASAPMAAIEALHLDTAYVEIGKALGLPTQAYMGLSDAKVLDAQAGAETFGSALLAALAGVNSVSGPGMLDYVLVFSLPKLVLDNELCGQALHLVREIGVLDDIPVDGLVEHLFAENHLIMAEHTTSHWPRELWLTSPVYDRDSRETWERKGAKTLEQRAVEEVEQRLAAYRQVETDPAIAAELRAIVAAGADGFELPIVEPAPEPAEVPASGEGRRRNRRRG